LGNCLFPRCRSADEDPDDRRQEPGDVIALYPVLYRDEQLGRNSPKTLFPTQRIVERRKATLNYIGRDNPVGALAKLFNDRRKRGFVERLTLLIRSQCAIVDRIPHAFWTMLAFGGNEKTPLRAGERFEIPTRAGTARITPIGGRCMVRRSPISGSSSALPSTQ
jgi:hypothetical protein